VFWRGGFAITCVRSVLFSLLLIALAGCEGHKVALPGDYRETTVNLPGGATMEMVWIEPGTFTMGSSDSESGRREDEGPQHEVEITQGLDRDNHWNRKRR